MCKFINKSLLKLIVRLKYNKFIPKLEYIKFWKFYENRQRKVKHKSIQVMELTIVFINI